MKKENINKIITLLSKQEENTFLRNRFASKTPMPSAEALKEIIERIKKVLFPGFFGYSDISSASVDYYIGVNIDIIKRLLAEQIKRGTCFNCNDNEIDCLKCIDLSEELTDKFINTLPEIKRLLIQDIKAAYDGDPAAKSYEEILFCYPGIIALIYHRIAHELLKLDIPLLPRLINENAHAITGIDIHPGAVIGESCFIDHGTGIVIGETCIIGRNVRIYQGVTLGAKSFPVSESGNLIKGIPRHPIIGDNVIIYSNASILGRITITAGSVVSCNARITKAIDLNINDNSMCNYPKTKVFPETYV